MKERVVTDLSDLPLHGKGTASVTRCGNLTFMLPEGTGSLVFSIYLYNKRRFGNVHDNALYWNFVVLTWLPIYGAIYWIPRL
jgi:hypothetical protein